jgi:hypothetical protein
VLFRSNLVAGDTNGQQDAFIRDRQQKTTRRVSVAADGSQGDGSSRGGAITADGRYAVLSSRATNLVPGDVNGKSDIFVVDTQTNEITFASVSSDGELAQDGSGAEPPSMSPDGRYVVFDSFASNLVPGDSNGRTDVFLRDRLAGLTHLISVSSSGAPGDGGSDTAFVAAGGRAVVFTSSATNLVDGDTNGVRDVFVRRSQ